MTNSLLIHQKLRTELEALEKRLKKVEEKYQGKPDWYKKKYGDRRLKKIQGKIDRVNDELNSEELRKRLKELIADNYPEVDRVLRNRL
jgi:hypothetical protein